MKPLGHSYVEDVHALKGELGGTYRPALQVMHAPAVVLKPVPAGHTLQPVESTVQLTHGVAGLLSWSTVPEGQVYRKHAPKERTG
jgi:hypothetical protein